MTDTEKTDRGAFFTEKTANDGTRVSQKGKSASSFPLSPCRTALTLRRADEGDLPFLLALEHEVFSDAWGEGGIRGQLSSPVGRSLIAEDESGRPVGYLFAMIMPPECEILRIAVSPLARRRGCGRALLAALAAQCAAEDTDLMLLDVRAGNAAAIALYTAVGFAPTGRRRDFYRAPREDAILMERRLSPHEN